MKAINDDDIRELLDNPNFMVCGSKQIINMKHVKSQHIVTNSSQDSLILVFDNGEQVCIDLKSWREAEKLYHEIDDKLIKIKTDLSSSN